MVLLMKKIELIKRDYTSYHNDYYEIKDYKESLKGRYCYIVIGRKSSYGTIESICTIMSKHQYYEVKTLKVDSKYFGDMMFEGEYYNFTGNCKLYLLNEMEKKIIML
jgi:hypothetical protein